MVRSSDRVRAAAHILRLVSQGRIELDAETLSAVVSQLEDVAGDVDQLEAHALIRRRVPVSPREDSLVALVHTAAELADPFWAASIMRALEDIQAGRRVAS